MKFNYVAHTAKDKNRLMFVCARPFGLLARVPSASMISVMRTPVDSNLLIYTVISKDIQQIMFLNYQSTFCFYHCVASSGLLQMLQKTS